MAVLSRSRRPTLALERRRPWPDFVVIFVVALLGSLGALMVYSSSAPRLEALGGDPAELLRRHVLFLALGVVVFILASLRDYRDLRHLAPAIYGLTVLALAMVLTPLGHFARGAQRWIEIGALQLQPSEFAKPALIITLAAVLAPAVQDRVRWRRVVEVLALTAVPSLLIFLQPDLGTMLVFGFITLVMLFAAGVTFRQLIVLLAGGGLGFVVLLRLGLLRTYQVARLTAFLDPAADPTQAGYNQLQSEIAIGSGQMFGKGLFAGSQTNLAFVPAQTTDFIFTAVGEQLGFVGAALVLAAYLVVIWRLLATAAVARDRFGSLVATGAAALITFHTFVNIGMTLGIMPVTGIPLPFMSHGGSSMAAMALTLGFAHAVWLRRSPIPGETYIL
ncbi:MAG: rod shape-determining protein RodA [Actinomycetota bacterium]|nr:rod shape-determining protein RodA [Actinomycetota bacterium]